MDNKVYEIIDTPWLRCPECGKVFIGEVTYEEGDPWANYTNHCPHCGYIITESEFEPIKQQ